MCYSNRGGQLLDQCFLVRGISMYQIYHSLFRAVLQFHCLHGMREFHCKSFRLCDTISRISRKSKIHFLCETKSERGNCIAVECNSGHCSEITNHNVSLKYLFYFQMCKESGLFPEVDLSFLWSLWGL